jgi:hypothetical protein
VCNALYLRLRRSFPIDATGRVAVSQSQGSFQTSSRRQYRLGLYFPRLCSYSLQCIRAVSSRVQVPEQTSVTRPFQTCQVNPGPFQAPSSQSRAVPGAIQSVQGRSRRHPVSPGPFQAPSGPVQGHSRLSPVRPGRSRHSLCVAGGDSTFSPGGSEHRPGRGRSFNERYRESRSTISDFRHTCDRLPN